MVRWTEAPEEPVYDLAERADDFEVEHPRRRHLRSVTFLLLLPALALIAYAVVRMGGLEELTDNAFLVGAMALTPYVTAVGLLFAVLTFLFGRRVLALVMLVVALLLGVVLGPRYLSEEQPQADGSRLRIMAANLYLGRADARTVVDLVREQQIDVLAMTELAPAAVSALDSAGLADLLPYRVYDDRVGGDGGGVAAKFPLRQIVLMPETVLSQPSVVVDLPGRQDDVDLTAVHVLPPLSNEDTRTWRTELSDLPRVTPDERVRILAGDFNATLDHTAFRELVERGYADAGEETGKGLDSTWQSLPTGPPLTLDHIVVDARCAISSYAVHNLPGSDHNAIVAEVILP